MPLNDKPFELIFLGPPVSGKGTQTELVANTFDIPHISTGVILQNIKAETNNPLAQEVASYMDNGKLVPTELVNRLVADRIKKDDCSLGYAMDGFPRTLEQAQYLSQITTVDRVFLINVSDEAIVERMSGRRVCKNGHTWHLKYSPPKDQLICDTCGESLFQRDDDKEETVKSRLEVYHREADAIVKFYEEQGLLSKINGEQSIEKVQQQIIKLLVTDLRSKIDWNKS